MSSSLDHQDLGQIAINGLNGQDNVLPSDCQSIIILVLSILTGHSTFGSTPFTSIKRHFRGFDADIFTGWMPLLSLNQ